MAGTLRTAWLIGKQVAAAALKAVADLARDVGAVVSCGGRPDLAGNALGRLEAPTLLTVGGLDDTVIELNKEAGRWSNASPERSGCSDNLRTITYHDPQGRNPDFHRAASSLGSRRL